MPIKKPVEIVVRPGQEVEFLVSLSQRAVALTQPHGPLASVDPIASCLGRNIITREEALELIRGAIFLHEAEMGVVHMGAVIARDLSGLDATDAELAFSHANTLLRMHSSRTPVPRVVHDLVRSQLLCFGDAPAIVHEFGDHLIRAQQLRFPWGRIFFAGAIAVIATGALLARSLSGANNFQKIGNSEPSNFDTTVNYS